MDECLLKTIIETNPGTFTLADVVTIALDIIKIQDPPEILLGRKLFYMITAPGFELLPEELDTRGSYTLGDDDDYHSSWRVMPQTDIEGSAVNVYFFKDRPGISPDAIGEIRRMHLHTTVVYKNGLYSLLASHT